MNKHAGGRPAKSGARRELKTFRLVPDAIERLETLAAQQGGSTSDVLNELLMTGRAAEIVDALRPRRMEVLPLAVPDDGVVTGGTVTRFRVLQGGIAADPRDDANRAAHGLERLKDALGGVLDSIEELMAEQAADAPEPTLGRKAARISDAYGQGFRDGMLEALETAYALLQAELLMSEPV